MSGTVNKVKFGLRNAHYAKATLDMATGVVSFGTPKPIPGSVNLSLDPQGDMEPFYADDMVYYTSTTNNGYEGDLEVAIIPDEFLQDILKEEEDENGVIIENSDVEPEHFALLFEFSGDVRKVRHCLYWCTATRPKIEGQTNEDKKNIKTDTLSIKSTPLPNGKVKVKTGPNTATSVYNNWYSAVYTSESAVSAAKLTGISIGALDLNPAFNADTTAYTVETENATNVVSATADTGVDVMILVNGEAHTSGQSATWETGTNTVTVIASKTGSMSTAYTVTVVKSEG